MSACRRVQKGCACPRTGTAQPEGAFAGVVFASPTGSTLPLTASEKLLQFGLYFKIP